MEDGQEFQANGVRQVTINKRWLWIITVAITVFVIITGSMLWVASTSRPATVNTGGYTNLEKW